MSSDKGEADSVDITSLALWDPYYVSDLVTLEDDSDGSSMEEELEPSELVRTMIKGFGTFVGFPIACCERRVLIFSRNLRGFGSSKRRLLLLVGQATLPKKV